MCKQKVALCFRATEETRFKYGRTSLSVLYTGWAGENLDPKAFH